MTPLEQLKKLHSDALTRLSEHPDFQLIKQLEPIIAGIEAEQTEALNKVDEAVQEEISELEETVTDEDAALAATAALGAAAAVGVSAVADELVDDENEVAGHVAENEAPEVFAASEPQDAVHPSPEAMPGHEAEHSAASAPEVETETAAPSEGAEVQSDLDASKFETEEAVIGSLDEELSDALANTDFTADLEAVAADTTQEAGAADAVQAPEVPEVSMDNAATADGTMEDVTMDDVETALQEALDTTQSGQTVENDIASEIEEELSIEALIDEQVAKLLSEERPT